MHFLWENDKSIFMYTIKINKNTWRAKRSWNFVNNNIVPQWVSIHYQYHKWNWKVQNIISNSNCFCRRSFGYNAVLQNCIRNHVYNVKWVRLCCIKGTSLTLITSEINSITSFTFVNRKKNCCTKWEFYRCLCKQFRGGD